MKEKAELLEHPQFNQILSDFLDEITSLNETLPLVMALVSRNEQLKKIKQQYRIHQNQAMKKRR
jgi:hypothetical protein